ncbi:MAG: Gfo/Idh/MocA family protein [Streptosporangiaceae bacterium]
MTQPHPAPPGSPPGTPAGGPVLRAAIIGAGRIGEQHAETLASRDDVELTAVCDVDTSRAEAVAAVTGAQVFADWREMLAADLADAVWVCTPPAAHAGPAVAVLDQGLPLYLEKPIARSLDDARLIAAAAARSGAVCAVGYQWHAVEVLDSARRILAGQPVGCLVGQSVGGTQSRPWFLDRAAGGGNLLERGSHHIDLARALAGEVTAVQAAASAVRMAPRTADPAAGDIDDAVTLILHFAGGGIGTIVVAWTSDSVPGSYWVEVTGQDVALRLDLDPYFRLSGTMHGAPVAALSQAPPFERSVSRFVTAVRAGDPAAVFCAPDDALRTLAVAAAAEEALASGQTVAVPDV